MKHLLICAVVTVASSVQAAERGMIVTEFDRIRVDGGFDVEVVTGKTPSGRMTGTPQALDRVKIETRGRTLVIRSVLSSFAGARPVTAGPVRIRVTTRDLKSADVVGAANVVIQRFQGDQVSLSLFGPGTLSVVGIKAAKLNLGVAGAGVVTLAGAADRAVVDVQGSGSLKAGALITQDLQLSAQGSTVVQAHATRTARINSAGSPTISVTGTATCTIEKAGPGTVACGR